MGEDGKMLYCASRNGTVYRFTPGQRQLTKVCDGQLSSSKWVSSVLNDDSFIWISTVGDGLYGYDLTNGKLHHWQYISERMGEQLSHNDVFRLLPIGNSRYLAVTWNGYTLLSLTPEREIKLRDFQSFLHNGKQYFETRMISGYYDEEGLLWIGTEGGGVLFSDLRQLFYHQYAQTRSNEICGIQMDEEGYVWLATFHKGVLRSTQPFDVSHSLSFESFDTGIPGLKTVLCSSSDENGGFWFGTQDGRVLRYGKDQKWDDMRIGTPGQPSPVVWSLLMVSDEQCWAGTSDGLYWVDFQRGTSTHVSWSNPQIPDHIHIRALAADTCRIRSQSRYAGYGNRSPCPAVWDRQEAVGRIRRKRSGGLFAGRRQYLDPLYYRPGAVQQFRDHTVRRQRSLSLGRFQLRHFPFEPSLAVIL